jgi:hypothetical protein
MSTTPEAAKRRMRKLSKDERRRLMEPALRAGAARVKARKLAEAIEKINAAGGFRKAVEQVRAAGYELEAAS